MDVTVVAEPAINQSAAGSAPRARVPDSVRRRLESMPAWTWQSWAAALWVTVIAGVLRFINLGQPDQLVFDEVYYANEGQQLLDHHVEWRYATDSAGQTTGSFPDFVVHPPLGKWIIAGGIKLFDGSTAVTHAFAYRFTAAVCGTLAVLIITRLARRLFRSTVLGCAAGLLMALDGMEFVLSRTAILDIFLMFFVLLALACLVLDRDERRRRWLREMEAGLDPSAPGRGGRPRISWRSVPWWRLAAGVSLGAACGVKWSGVWFLPLFAILIIWWGVSLRKTVGSATPWRDALLDETGWIFALVGLAVVTYLSTWTGWFLSDDGWKRHFLLDASGQPLTGPIAALRNLWEYHKEILHFHDNLSTPHPYQSWPWQWLILGRPVAFYWSSAAGCGTNNCAAEILLLGTPALWWAFIPALLATAWFGVSRRDWRAGLIILGVVAGIVPWFPYELGDRTMFYFYALPAEPLLILAVVYALGCLINAPAVVGVTGRFRLPRIPASDRRLYATIFAGAFVLLVAVCFWWYYPLYVGTSIPYDSWLRHMLLGNRWI